MMFGIGPAYLFLLQHRLPVGLMRKGWQPWVSTMATNVAIAILVGAMMWLVGVGQFLLVHMPITPLAASIGVWLFYVQHQFEGTTWVAGPWLEACTRRRCTEARTMIFPSCCAGLRQTSAFTTCTTCAADPLLSIAAGIARPSRAFGRRPADPSRELVLCASGSLGRGPSASSLVSGATPRLRANCAQDPTEANLTCGACVTSG